MPRKKLKRFLEISQSDNVIETGKPIYTTIKGNWRKDYFKNENPIVLELACGQGEYTVGLSQVYPNKNYIGIDIKGDRIARGSAKAIELGLTNVAFLRASMRFLEEFFEENEIDEIWIIHPDPQPLDKWEKKRLTFSKFLELYKKFLKPESLLMLKTDDIGLYEYSLESFKNFGMSILDNTDDLYNSELNKEHHGIETYYEKKFTALGRKINYIKAKF
jgi:tRNA (guanine-N7-)-methyltransferase